MAPNGFWGTFGLLLVVRCLSQENGSVGSYSLLAVLINAYTQYRRIILSWLRLCSLIDNKILWMWFPHCRPM